MRPAVLVVALAAGCMTLPAQSRAPGPEVVHVAPAEVCTCLADLRQAEAIRIAAASEPSAPHVDPAPDTGSRTGALIRVVTGAGGILTGNPPAWALLGQAASLALSFFGRLRRRNTP